MKINFIKKITTSLCSDGEKMFFPQQPLLCLNIMLLVLVMVAMICERAVAADIEKNTVSVSSLLNNRNLGCDAICKRTGPMLSDDPVAASLPRLIRSSLTPPQSEWFGANESPGANTNPLVHSIAADVQSGPFFNVTASFDFTSTVYQTTPSFQRRNQYTGTINEMITQGSPSGDHQILDYFFNADSLTDANGDLLGSVSGGLDGNVRGSYSLIITEGTTQRIVQNRTFIWNPIDGWLLQ